MWGAILQNRLALSEKMIEEIAMQSGLPQFTDDQGLYSQHSKKSLHPSLKEAKETRPFQ